jgi:5-formyltetrahydrofolate cyclo-ligase
MSCAGGRPEERIVTNKKELRQALRKRLAAVTPAELHARSFAACGLLFEQKEFKRAQTLMIFLSTQHEVDTAPVALQAWADYKRVLAPRVSWEQRRMLPIEIHSLTSDVKDGLMGVREPFDGMPIPVADIDLVIVPGLAFDGVGNRLGRGRGFYDRFLSHRDFRGVCCALALEEQVVDSVPAEECDVRMNMLVTDQRVRRFKR